MTLGEYIRQVRTERGYTNRELAKRCGVSSAEISRLETGVRQEASVGILSKLAEVLAVDFYELADLAAGRKKKETPAPPAIQGPDDIARDIHTCADEIYAKDPAWMKTAYRIATDLNEEDRALIREMAETFRNRRTNGPSSEQ